MRLLGISLHFLCGFLLDYFLLLPLPKREHPQTVLNDLPLDGLRLIPLAINSKHPLILPRGDQPKALDKVMAIFIEPPDLPILPIEAFPTLHTEKILREFPFPRRTQIELHVHSPAGGILEGGDVVPVADPGDRTEDGVVEVAVEGREVFGGQGGGQGGEGVAGCRIAQ